MRRLGYVLGSHQNTTEPAVHDFPVLLNMPRVPNIARIRLAQGSLDAVFPIVCCDRCAGVFAIVLCAMAALGGLSSDGVFATVSAASSGGGAETGAAASGQLAQEESLLLSLRSSESATATSLLKQHAMQQKSTQKALELFLKESKE